MSDNTIIPHPRSRIGKTRKDKRNGVTKSQKLANGTHTTQQQSDYTPLIKK